MNNCLADLSRLIPAEYMKKGRGRVEKTEIIEMAIKHMKYLQSNVSSSGKDFYFFGLSLDLYIGTTVIYRYIRDRYTYWI